MEGNPTYEQVIYSIKLLREQFQSDNKMNVVGDKVILYKEDGTYKVSFNMIMANGKALSMGYDINGKSTIPSSLLAKQVLLGHVLIEETVW